MRKPFFNQKNYIVIGIIILICIIDGLIFIKYTIQNHQYLFSKKPITLPTAMDPNFLTQINECFIPVAAAYGYDLRITAGFRSIAQQNQLYQEGRTINGHIITEASAGRSIHNYGFAVDVVDRYRGYNINWNRLINIGTYCGLESGGPGDLPHFEHRAGLTTADFAAGMRPSPLTLSCAIMDERVAENKPLTLQDLKICNAPKF